MLFPSFPKDRSSLLNAYRVCNTAYRVWLLSVVSITVYYLLWPHNTRR